MQSDVLLALRPKHAARALNVSPRTLWSWVADGRIPHIKMGRTILFPVSELQRWLAGLAAEQAAEQTLAGLAPKPEMEGAQADE
jgi:excisionase family DNA binding protein